MGAKASNSEKLLRLILINADNLENLLLNNNHG